MPSLIGRWPKGRRDRHVYGPRRQKAAAMAAESSTARLTLSSYRQLERKGRPRVAAEIQCTQCERRVTRASGEEPKGELCGLAQSRAAGMETARPTRAGAAGLASCGNGRTASPPVAHPGAAGRVGARGRLRGRRAFPSRLPLLLRPLGNDRVSSPEYGWKRSPVYHRVRVRI